MCKFEMSVMVILSLLKRQQVTGFCLFESSDSHYKEKPCVQTGETKSRLSNKHRFFFFKKLTWPHPIYFHWSFASGRSKEWHIKRLLSTERSLFFPFKQCIHKHLTHTKWRIGFNRCLLALCQSLMNKQSDIAVTYLINWLGKMLNWQIDR